MKTLTLLSAMLLSMSAYLTQDTDLVTNFLSDSRSLENTEFSRPIAKFKALAETAAAKKTDLTKENIQEILTEAKSYKYLVITTGDHTIVKVTDLDMCLSSGSWGACMPYGEGYISRQGNLEFQQDHLNNIIGTPGSQVRTAYFFE